MAETVEKVSLSLSIEDVEWARGRAAAESRSLSSVVSEAIEKARRDEARLEVLHFLGESALSRPEEASEIRSEWQD